MVSLQAIRPIVTLLSGPMWGSLSDHCGQKKLVLLIIFISSVFFRLCIPFIGVSRTGLAVALCASSLFYSAVPVSELRMKDVFVTPLTLMWVLNLSLLCSQF
jgi:hypothetical protein